MSKQVEITVMVYADGKLIDEHTNSVPDWAVDFVASTAIVQVEDPDLELARDFANERFYSDVEKDVKGMDLPDFKPKS
jgi:hypothetical protein